MAYVFSSDTELFELNSASITPALPAHVADDLLLLCITQDTGSSAIATASSGWAMIGTQAVSGGARQAWAYKIATSGAEPDPTFTGTNDTWIVQKYVVKDADTASPINGNARVDWNNPATSTVTSPSLTTTSNNCLIMHSIGGDSSFTAFVNPSQLQMDQLTIGTAEVSQSGWNNQLTAGAIPTFTWQLSTNTEGGNLWAVAINNKSGGTVAPFCTTSITPIRVYGAGSFAGSFSNLATLTASIGGIPTTATASTISVVTIPEIYGGGNQMSQGITTGTAVYQGAIDTLSSPVNIQNKLISFAWRSPATSVQVLASGWFFVVADTSGNYVVYNLIRRPPFLANQTYMFVAEIGQGSVFASSGTIDYTQINRFGWFQERSSSTTQAGVIIVKNLFLHDKVTAINGGASKPINVDVFSKSITTGLIGFGTSSLQGAGQFLTKSPMQFGDGSNPSYVNVSTQSVEVALTNDSYVRPQTQKYLPDINNADITIFASPSDVMNFTSSIFATTQQNAFTINSSSSSSASYDFTGCSIVGYQVVNNATGVVINNATLSGTRGITLNGGKLLNCNISKPLTAPAITTNNPRVENCNFTSSGTGHAIELTATGTFDFEGNTFSGYGADSTTNASIYNNSGGLVTLNIPQGDTVPTIRNGAGATTTIVQPTDNQKVVLTGGVANSRIQLYDLTSNTELAEQIVTSFPFTWEDTNPYVADRQIRLRVAYQNGATAKKFIDQVIGTATESEPTINFLISQEDDLVYNGNAIDGSTVTGVTIDDTALLIEVDTGSISYAQLYAYEVYWLYTSAGIIDEGKYINAVDNANYIFENIQIKNVSSPTAPVVITGGWGRDSVTNQTIDIIDTTGGAIFSNPDLVIAFATGSGLSPAQDATLSKLDTLTEDVSGLRFTTKALEQAPSGGGGGGGITAADVWSHATRTLTASLDPSAATIASQVRTELTTELARIDATVSSRLASAGYTTPPTAAAIRSEIDSNSTKLDVAVSTRLASAGYTAPDNSSITAIKAKTDNLPASPASEGNVTAVGSAVSALGTPLQAGSYTAPDNAGIAAIKAKTDNLPSDPASNTQVNTRLASSSYTAPDNSGITAIKAKTDLLEFTGSLVNSIAQTVSDKANYSLSDAERQAIAAQVEYALLDELDGQALLDAIVNAIGNQNIDQVALVAAIRAELERNGGDLKLIKGKTDLIPGLF